YARGLHDQRAAPGPAGRRRAPGTQARWPGSPVRAWRPVPAPHPEALLLEERQVDSLFRIPGRQRSRLLGGQRLSPARRPVEGGALLGPGDRRHAADAFGSGAPPPGALSDPSDPHANVRNEPVSGRDSEIWIAAGLRTPFLRVDGSFAGRDAIGLSVPVV